MPIPSLSIIARAEDSTAEVVIYGVANTSDGPVADGFDTAWLRLAGVTGKPESFTRSVVDGNSVAFVGLGAADSAGAIPQNALRSAAGCAVRALKGVATVALCLPTSSEADVLAVLEGAALGAYSFDALKKHDPDAQFAREIAVAVGDANVSEATVRTASIVAEAVYLTRDLSNTPPNLLAPADVARIALDDAAELPVSIRVLEEDQLEAEGFGGIVGVGKGSANPPRMVIAEYSPSDARASVALVGKGITFDTGGLSLKPADAMLHMKFDMTGAATVYAVVAAVARLGLPIKLTAYLCLAENMPSATAQRPDDVITIRGGQTVEVTNTDAEGRLVMADGLVLASEAQPDAIIDVATLTGAQVVALGNRYSAIMGNDESLTGELVEASKLTGELLWPMPLPEELGDVLQSDVADMVNAKPGNRAAGMLLAGAFLQKFVGERDGKDIPWAHIDIAGPSTNHGKPYGINTVGATGVMVRALIKFAKLRATS